MKTCTKCGEEYPSWTSEYFPFKNKSKGLLRSNCKKCEAKYQAEYRMKNNERFKEYESNYRLENHESITIKRRLYSETNHNNVLNSWNKYRKNNKESIRSYQIRNMDKLRMYSHNRRARVLKLPHNLTDNQWKDIKDCFDNKCAYCGNETELAQDHFVALSKGGEYTKNNIIPACKSCNSSKGASSYFE